MTSRRAFVVVFFSLSTVVAGAVASILIPAGGAVNHGVRRDRPLDAAAGAAQAQSLPKQPFPTPVAVRPPLLLVREDDAAPSTPLVLEQARYDVTVTGLGARTRATLVFRNDLGRVLDGELVFPLPEGALVSGFALDVNGRMADGVVVEAQEARIAFETEVRRGVDPGLVEWVRGNNFRTRVFPIPARGRRTISLEYLTDLAVSTTDGRRDAIYELPMRFPAPLDELALKIEIVRGQSTPIVRSGLANLTFSRWEDRYVAETTRRNVQPGDDLRVSLPDVPHEETRIETAATGETFFVVDDFPTSAIQGRSPAPRRIGIAWDASLSRADADRDRDLGIIAAHVARLGSVEVEVIVFRNVPDAPRRFSITNGQADALVAYLREQPCDGATNLAALRFPTDASYSLLFSDGLSTVGGGANDGPVHPVFVLSGDPRADHARLRALAQRTGGDYFNLQRTTDADVLPQLGQPVLSLVSVDVDRNAVADLEPSGARAVTGGRVRIAGRLLVPNARLTLRYGLPGQPPLETRTIALQRPRSSKATGLVALLWAQQRLATLGVDPEANHEDLVGLGQRFSIVTPGTSLLVLETLKQYLQHDVTPPVTSPELRAAFLERHSHDRVAKSTRQRDNTARVVAMWENRVTWWSREFNYLPDFRFEQPKLADRERTSEAVQGRLASSIVPPPPPSPAGPAAMAAPPSSPRAVGERATVSAASPLVEAAAAAADRGEETGAAGLRIAIKPWNPDTPYLRSLRADTRDAYRRYLAERDTYGRSPAFYLDCADYLIEHGQRDLGIRVLTSVAELKLEDARLLRVLAHRLTQVDELDLAIELFDRVRRLRPEEPQSYRDLALALDRRAGARGALAAASIDDYTRALALFSEIVNREWDARFPEIEVIALIEANRIQSILERNGSTRPWPLDGRLRRLLDFDVRVVLTWDTDQTDMDLWVVEPSGETCFFSHASTTIGGQVSKDFTGGYGPEEYTVRRAMGGNYQVKANFYGSRAQDVTGPTTVQATVVTDYGRPTEQRRALTLRLTTARDVVDIGAVVAAGSRRQGVK